MESDTSPIKDNWSFAIMPDDGTTGPMVLTRIYKREKSMAPKPGICNIVGEPNRKILGSVLFQFLTIFTEGIFQNYGL